MRLSDPGEPMQLVEESVPQLKPGPGELLVCVRAAGIIPSELLWYPTSHRKNGDARTRAVPAHEFSGVIAATGDDIAGLRVGAEIFGMNDWFSNGALAEYCLTSPAFVAAKPRRLTHIEAASVPIGALTAWQGLFEHASLQSGERVLVHGGAGGVGVFAVQLARFRGAHVTATASTQNLDFVSQLGAHQVLNYQTERFEDIGRQVDVVFDTVGGETLDRSWGILKPNGRMVTIAAGGENSTEPRVKQAFFIVEPNQKQLSEIGDLLAKGRIIPVVDTVLPFSQAPAAYSGQVRERRGRGRIVVSAERQGVVSA